jgi:hypothetical protein
MMRTRWALVGLVTVMVAVLVACGGGDDGGDGERSAPTTEAEAETVDADDWVDDASDICQDHLDEAAENDEEDPGDSLETAREVFEDFADEIEDLGVPEGLEDEAEELIDALDHHVELLDEGLEVVDDGEDPHDDEDWGEELGDNNDDTFEAVEDLDLDCEQVVHEIEIPDVTVPPTDTVPTETVPSTDSSTSVLDLQPLAPAAFMIFDYGTDAGLDILADTCFDGDMQSCDDLYRTSPVGDELSYEAYGATCGGRLVEERPGECVSLI